MKKLKLIVEFEFSEDVNEAAVIENTLYALYDAADRGAGIASDGYTKTIGVYNVEGKGLTRDVLTGDLL